MTETRYPIEKLDELNEDDGTMPHNVSDFRQAIIGHRIISAAREGGSLILTLDNETKVSLVETDDCCAYTMLESFFAHPEMVDHVILGVGTTGRYTRWHIYADFGDVMELDVAWSCGNPFYYGYGFNIVVEPVN